MKALLLIVSFLMSSMAYATESLVFEDTGEFRASHKHVQFTGFAYSKKKGTASIYVYSNDNGCIGSDWCMSDQESFSHKVPGLYFDRTVGKRGAVMFDAGEEQIVCAYRRWIIGPKYTGLCKIKTNMISGSRGAYRLQLFVDL